MENPNRTRDELLGVELSDTGIPVKPRLSGTATRKRGLGVPIPTKRRDKQ
jgi:hypothetical protein